MSLQPYKYTYPNGSVTTLLLSEEDAAERKSRGEKVEDYESTPDDADPAEKEAPAPSNKARRVPNK